MTNGFTSTPTSNVGTHRTTSEEVLVIREPIYRSDMSVLGYELSFRDGGCDHASFVDESQATADVITNSLMDIGLQELVKEQLAFINFERDFLMSDYCESLPAGRVVLEMFEMVEPDAAVIKRLSQLRTKGYQIALDCSVCSDPDSPILQVADFVKVDLLANEEPSFERVMPTLRKYPAAIPIAQKVQTPERLARAKELGFKHFQGHFLCRPQNITVKQLGANELAMIRLQNLVNKPDITLPELECAIKQDLSLSYKLLRYVNSAFCSVNRKVESIRHAALLVGLEKMRTWANLMLVSSIENVRREVIATGIIRARMCELLATKTERCHPQWCFLAGLLSVMDAVLDCPMEQVMGLLSLSEDITEALLFGGGEIGTILRSVLAYERRQWSEATASLQLRPSIIDRTYVEAVAWYNNIGLSDSE
jgi:EAL and modified HD-GYP domain-containing signal transduction protein